MPKQFIQNQDKNDHYIHSLGISLLKPHNVASALISFVNRASTSVGREVFVLQVHLAQLVCGVGLGEECAAVACGGVEGSFLGSDGFRVLTDVVLPHSILEESSGEV